MMDWMTLKAILLAHGTVRVTGAPVDRYIARSTAGPGAGGPGSIFFSIDGRRVRLSLHAESPVLLVHEGEGAVSLTIQGDTYQGRLEEVALHCPRQAYVTISERCIFGCRYCAVPLQQGRVKSTRELVDRILGVRDRIDAIAITGGVADSVEEEEGRALELVRHVRPLDLPIGVSIYPESDTPARLHAAGVAEVKFNLETATDALFQQMCPGLHRELMQGVLDRSVECFGENHVFSNIIVGLGETDAEIETCVEDLCDRGVIPVLRPLLPAAGVRSFPRPDAPRLLSLCTMEERILKRAGLDPTQARTMCIACTGCDLVPGRDT
jgi:biotin synthase-related radical SAM superfamily protein